MNASIPVYQVSDLVGEMRRLVETSYPEIWIEGELSSLSTPASGHLYFSLKDEQSQLRCAMFRSRASISRYRPTAGDLVRVRAKISVYAARGDLQCIVQHIEEAGEGLLQRQFDELKTKLNAEGLFEATHKQALPGFAKQIALITSPTGAAIRDILSTLERRAPSIPVTVYPTVVQGESAPAAIVQAIADAVQHQRADVIILSRGGGSLEDLWCFNDELVARAIYDCPIPVVCGVGHEVDVTIADLVADHRAPTPTAAAEILSPDTAQMLAQLNSMAFRFPRSMVRLLQQRAQSVDISFHQLVHPSERLRRNKEVLQHSGQRLQSALSNRLRSQSESSQQMRRRLIHQTPRRQLARRADLLGGITRRLVRAQRHSQQSTQQQFQAISEQLNLVSPLATLGRGFSITRDAQQQIIKDTKSVNKDDEISVQLNAGTLRAKVTERDDA